MSKIKELLNYCINCERALAGPTELCPACQLEEEEYYEWAEDHGRETQHAFENLDDEEELPF